jgi:phage/plasmid-associated DNA primase
MDEARAMINPVGAFVADRCDVGPDERVSRRDLYDAWKAWCEANGRDHPGDMAGFGRNLRTVLPKVRDERPGGGNSRARFYTGISLRPEEGSF